MSRTIEEIAKEWVSWDTNPKTKKEIQTLIDEKKTDELKERLEKRIAFGTAGLRGAMKAGYSFMNDLTVRQATQGLCAYLEKEVSTSKKQGVVIGFDGRHNSHSFANQAAATFVSHNIPVYLFSHIVPTPFVAYATHKLGCSAGIMVTASHNPKDDNGYKVYWSNGCQIVSPVDQGIAKCIEENLEPWKIDVEGLNNSPLVKNPESIPKLYYEEIQKWSFFKGQHKNTLKITYTAMHGVGAKFTAGSFEAFGLDAFIPVPEQINPDPEFPTVAFPNPEEGKGALKLAMETADKEGSTLILANDPDADRLAVAEKTDGNWKIFTGDELGILLAYWVCTNYIKKEGNVDKSKLAVLNSAVSCKMLEQFAKVEGLYYEETLTGFKWLGSKAEELSKKGMTCLYAYEEAIGYMIGTTTLDKDGVCAAAVFAEMSYVLHSEGKNATKLLNEVYQKYGYFITKNKYFFCHDPNKMFKIFEEMRNGGQYHTKVGNFEVENIRDLKGKGYDSSKPDKKPILPTSSSSEMITWYFKNGALVTLRGSGTEPKLKYYAQLSGNDPNKVTEELNALVDDIIKQLLQPEKYGLIPPSDS